MMPVATYLKNKQKKIKSKYHQVAKRFESQYELIHGKVTSRFHRDTNETKLNHININNLITKSTVSIESNIKSKKIIPSFLITSNNKLDMFYPDIIDLMNNVIDLTDNKNKKITLPKKESMTKFYKHFKGPF